MNWLDLIILLPLVGGVISGYRNGFVGELASLAGLVLGVWGAIKFSGLVANWIEGMGVDLPYTNIIAFVVTFLAITILMQVVSGLISHLLDALLLGWFNRVAGIFAGLLKAVLFVGVVLFVIEVLDDRRTLIPNHVQEKSVLYEPMSDLVPTLLPFLQIDQLLDDRPEEESF